jgi:adenine phosphoribosyltransferase
VSAQSPDPSGDRTGTSTGAVPPTAGAPQTGGAAPPSGPARAPAASLSPTERLARIGGLIRDVPDFPKPGILFRDITTVLRDPVAWRATVDQMCDAVDRWPFDVVVGIESRGFILGSAMAYQLGVGFVPVRKPGKLPAAVHSVDYALEYGLDSLEIHRDALEPGHKVLIVDDLLATGGTAAATVRLVQAAGGQVTGVSVLVELADLGGRALLAAAAPQAPLGALVTY